MKEQLLDWHLPCCIICLKWASYHSVVLHSVWLCISGNVFSKHRQLGYLILYFCFKLFLRGKVKYYFFSYEGFVSAPLSWLTGKGTSFF